MPASPMTAMEAGASALAVQSEPRLDAARRPPEAGPGVLVGAVEVQPVHGPGHGHITAAAAASAARTASSGSEQPRQPRCADKRSRGPRRRRLRPLTADRPRGRAASARHDGRLAAAGRARPPQRPPRRLRAPTGRRRSARAGRRRGQLVALGQHGRPLPCVDVHAARSAGPMSSCSSVDTVASSRASRSACCSSMTEWYRRPVGHLELECEAGGQPGVSPPRRVVARVADLEAAVAVHVE